MKPALGINKPDDWYSITNVQAVKAGGSTIIRKHYHGSLIRALATIYPDHEWQAWRFRNVSGRWWEDLDNQRRYLRWFEAQEGIRTQTDWYTVPADKLRAKHGAYFLKKKTLAGMAILTSFPLLSRCQATRSLPTFSLPNVANNISES
jgi:hypothetical protein